VGGVEVYRVALNQSVHGGGYCSLIRLMIAVGASSAFVQEGWAVFVKGSFADFACKMVRG
jgi:hypothetical protein